MAPHKNSAQYAQLLIVAAAAAAAFVFGCTLEEKNGKNPGEEPQGAKKPTLQGVHMSWLPR